MSDKTLVHVDLGRERANLAAYLEQLPLERAVDLLATAGRARHVDAFDIARTVNSLDYFGVMKTFIEAKAELAVIAAMGNCDEAQPSPEDVKAMLSIGGKEQGEITLHGMRAHLTDTNAGIRFTITNADGREVFTRSVTWATIDARREANGWD